MKTGNFKTYRGDKGIAVCILLWIYEEKFIKEVAFLVSEILSIGYNERRIVEALLVNGLKNRLDNNRSNNPGLLQQYAASQLEDAAGRLRDVFDIPKEIKINHDNASHAKYEDMCRWIRDNYKGLSEIKEDVKPAQGISEFER
jgi:hypothetical protein